MSDTKYNGWANYETWLTKLWIDNDEGTSMHAHDTAQEMLENAATTDYLSQEETACIELGDFLRDMFDDEANELMPNASLLSDLLAAALRAVDWYEISESYINDIKQSQAA
ncbi:MAG: hypothetical protein H8D23_03995 [Candidatus Brocadiales bacterium]|nr:hypothetical protein [Candidatus Brocadiales bacterium]